MVIEAAEFVKSKIDGEYETGVICGSGLGGLCDRVENPIYVNYSDISGFPVSTAPGHMGRFVFGTLSGKKVVCMQGRIHYYEGYTAEPVIMPVRVMKLLGVKNLIVTNAAGGINEGYNVGDIMMISDHINFTGINPLVGKNDARFGVRFPDMSYAYSPSLREIAAKCAEKTGVDLREGVYLGCSGPSYETPAEIKAFRALGADAVGMSTVMEVIAANHCKMEVLGFSLIANKAAGMSGNRLTEQEVIDIGKEKANVMRQLVCAVIGELQ